MALLRQLSSRRLFPVLASSLSTGTLNYELEKSKHGCLRDPFLQPIEPPKLLDAFPDYTITRKIKGERLSVTQQDCFAIVQLGPHQFKVTPDDKIFTDKIPLLPVNSEIHLHKVLVWASKDETIVGRPFITGSYVEAVVEVRPHSDLSYTLDSDGHRNNAKMPRSWFSRRNDERATVG